VHSKAGDEALSHVRQDAVDAALCNIADMNFYIGQAGAFDAVFQCEASIGEARGIHHQAFEALIYGLIDTIDRFAFNVAVENIKSVAMLPGVRL
jgi:ethanolamine ammonia-lyase large subunit